MGKVVAAHKGGGAQGKVGGEIGIGLASGLGSVSWMGWPLGEGRGGDAAGPSSAVEERRLVAGHAGVRESRTAGGLAAPIHEVETRAGGGVRGVAWSGLGGGGAGEGVVAAECGGMGQVGGEQMGRSCSDAQSESEPELTC